MTDQPFVPRTESTSWDELVAATPDSLDEWRALRGDELVQAMLGRRWWACEDDTIGGWAICITGDPPSAGYPTVGGFLSQALAEHIVRLHNVSLGLGDG
ncbi:MAG TPA: hypothetical protein VI172_08300 [Candidatus Dormibacteraeota bacterium]